MIGSCDQPAHFADEVHAVAIRQAEVENDEVRFARAGLDQPLLHGLGLEHGPALRFERVAHEAADLPLVFDQHRDRRRLAHG